MLCIRLTASASANCDVIYTGQRHREGVCIIWFVDGRLDDRTLCQVKRCESGLLIVVKSSYLVAFPARQNRKIIKLVEMAADKKPFGFS